TTWTNVPGIVIGVVFLVLLFPDGRMPSRRWWPVGLGGALAAVVPTVVLAIGTWPLRGPALTTPAGEGSGAGHPPFLTRVRGGHGAGGGQCGRAGAAVPPRRSGTAPADQVVRLRRRPEHPARDVRPGAAPRPLPRAPGGGRAAGRGGHRHLPVPAVGHRPADQPHPGLRPAHRPARCRLRRAGP